MRLRDDKLANAPWDQWGLEEHVHRLRQRADALLARAKGLFGQAESLLARVDLQDYRRRLTELAEARPGLRRLALSWGIVLAVTVAGVGVLEALGPPRDPSQEQAGVQQALAETNPPASVPATRAAKAPPVADIPALLAKVQSQVAEAPDGQPPGAAVASALQRIAASLPNASADDRELVNDMASDLFDRAKAALQAGKVDEEQRWLALGAILAPPPDLAPGDTEVADAGSGAPGARPQQEARQEFTPNEAEADESAPAPPQKPAARQDANTAGALAPTTPTAPAAPEKAASPRPTSPPVRAQAAATPSTAAPEKAAAASQNPAPAGAEAAVTTAMVAPNQGSAEGQAGVQAHAQTTEPAAPAAPKHVTETAPPLSGSSPAQAMASSPPAEAGTLPRASEATGSEAAAVAMPAPNAERDVGQTAASKAPPSEPGPQQAVGTRLVVHFPAGSPGAEAQAKALAEQLGADFDHADAVGESGGSPVGVIRYGGAGAHVTARELGRMLGRMGYRWQLEKLAPNESGSQPRTVEVWIPGGAEPAQAVRPMPITPEFRPPPRFFFRPRMQAHWRGWGPWWFPGWL